MKAINLKTEYLKNPIGIDIPNPRLFWNCDKGVKQTAYQIVASSGNETILDTGKVNSSQMTGIPFAYASLSNATDRATSISLLPAILGRRITPNPN